MNRKIYGMTTGLLAATLALGLGACNGDESEDGQSEGQRGSQRGAQRSTTEITMQTLAGDWGFDAEEVRSNFQSMVQANLDEIPDANARAQARAMMEQGMEEMVVSMSEATITLRADGTMTGVSKTRGGEEDNASGTWTLDNRNFSMTIRPGDGSPEEELTGRVIDSSTIEVDFDELADGEMKMMLRKRS